MQHYPESETEYHARLPVEGFPPTWIRPTRIEASDGAPFPFDPALAKDEWQDILCRHAVLPCRMDPDGPVLAASTFTDALRAAEALGMGTGPVSVNLVPRSGIVDGLAKRYGPALTRCATDGLQRSMPEYSAATGFAPWVRWSAIGAMLLLLAGLVFSPGATVLILWLAFTPYFLATMVLRTLLMANTLRSVPPALPPRKSTPVVSILVPVYGEADSLPALIDALCALDYPVRALDIKILLEEDDTATIAEARRLTTASSIECLVVPPGGPRTKPKAMNFALPFVRGEIVGIFDAEDAPEPAQISRAVAALEQGGDDVVCAQARLSHYNVDDNILTRCVAMEYALWFDLLLNGLARAGMPIPLGGTSLYFRADALRAVGAWDPHNVTEDADLGLRLARAGKRTVIFDSTTLEEANGNALSWIRQRSRWIKGYMLTWAVHMRDPVRLGRELGWLPMVAINILLLDGFLSFLIQPVMVLAGVVATASGAAPWIGLSGMAGAGIVFAVLLGGQVLLMTGAFVAARRRFGWRVAIGVPMLWPYWMLGGIAAIRAVGQLFTDPQFWDKTVHCTSPVARARREAVLRSAYGD